MPFRGGCRPSLVVVGGLVVPTVVKVFNLTPNAIATGTTRSAAASFSIRVLGGGPGTLGCNLGRNLGGNLGRNLGGNEVGNNGG